MRGIAASRREQVIPGIVRRLSGRGRRAFARHRVEIDDRPADDDAVSAGFAACLRIVVREGWRLRFGRAAGFDPFEKTSGRSAERAPMV
jgi:hypothetical protein